MNFFIRIYDVLYYSHEPKSQIQIEIDRIIKEDPKISYLNKKMKVPIIIKECGEGIRSLYHIKNKEIWVDPFRNDINSLEEPLLHEFIHAYDHLVNKIPLSTVNGLARSEIHAMKLCECKNAWFVKRCTKQKAIEAVSLSINNEERAERVVNEVFNETYNDEFLAHPFD